MYFQSFSFSAAHSTANLLKTKTFKEFSLLLSRGCLPWVPSVLLLISSSSVKKYGRSFTAHLCLLVSCWSAACTPGTFLGVTQVRITSSATGISSLLSLPLVSMVTVMGAEGLSGVAGRLASISSLRKVAIVSMSIVNRSWFDDIHEELKFSSLLNWKKKKKIVTNLFLVFKQCCQSFHRLQLQGF